MSHNPSHIIVTPKGLELQVQLLKEVTSSNFPQIKSLQVLENPRKTKQHHISTSVSTSLSPFPKPRAGYFGPKEPTISIADPAQDYLFYPNYLQQSPQETVSRHFCVWKPTSTTKSAKSIEPVIPKGRYVHHSLFHHAVDSKVGEDPSIDTLNRLTFLGPWNAGNTGGLNDSRVKNQTPAMSRKNVDVTEIKESMVLDSYHQKNHSQTFYNNNKSMLNNSSSQFRTTGSWSRFRGTTTDFVKEEKYIEKHQIQQKEYEKMLKRFAEEKARTRLKHEENQNEPPEFIKKMKSAEKDIKQLQGKKFNEDSRFVRRLRDFQAQKYEKTWKAHEWSEVNSGTVERFVSKKKGVRGGPLYNVSAAANDPNETEKSINSTKIKTEEQKEDEVKLLESKSSKVLGRAGSRMKAVSPKNDKKFLDFIKS